MNSQPVIKSFTLKKITPDSILLTWELSDAHSIIIKEDTNDFINVSLKTEYEIVRNPDKKMELELLATNLESRLEASAKLSIAPPPRIQNFSYRSATRNKILLKAETAHVKTIFLEGNDIEFKEEIIIYRQNIKGNELKMIAEGFNEGEFVEKTLIISDKPFWTTTSLFVLGGGILAALFLLVLSIYYLAGYSNKSHNTPLAKSCTIEEEQDSIDFAKAKIGYLLQHFTEIEPTQLKQEMDCLKHFFPGFNFLLLLETEEGRDYDELFDYLSTQGKTALKADSFLVINNKIKTFAHKIGEPEVVLAPPSSLDKTSEEDNSIVIEQLPGQFQGTVYGKLRQMTITEQSRSGNIIEFRYSILGSYSEKNKLGKLDLNTARIELESFGGAKFSQGDDSSCIIQSDDNELVMKSI